MRKDERKINTELVFESLRCYNIEKSNTSFVAIIDYIEYNKKKRIMGYMIASQETKMDCFIKKSTNFAFIK